MHPSFNNLRSALKMKRITALIVAILGAVLMDSSRAEGEGLVPLNPASRAAVEPLAMAMQVAEQLARCVTNKELASIHNEDLVLSAAVSSLRTNAAAGANPESFKADLIGFGLSVSRLHSEADAGNQSQSESELSVVRQNFAKFKQDRKS